jgi:hypothetical protein
MLSESVSQKLKKDEKGRKKKTVENRITLNTLIAVTVDSPRGWIQRIQPTIKDTASCPKC